jgi:hypothetical protein
MAKEAKISDEINKLKTNLEKQEEIVKKANSLRDIKMNMLKEAKEDILLTKDEIKKYLSDVKNFKIIAEDKILVKKARAKLIKLELETMLSEYNSLQTEYTQIHTEIENQVNK